MGVEYLDGFEYGIAADLLHRWDSALGNYSVSPSFGRTNKGLSLNNGYIQRDIGFDRTQWVIGAAFRVVATQLSSLPIFEWRYSGTGAPQGHLAINPQRRLEVRRGGAGGPLLGRANDPLNLNQWYYVEWQLLIDDTFGISKVWVNGQVVLNPSQPLDTAAINPFTCDILRLGYRNPNPLYDFHYQYDDLYVKSIITEEPSPNLGDGQIAVALPVGDATPIQWAVQPGAVDHYTVLTTVNDDTDYIHTATAGNIDMFNFSDLAGVSGMAAIRSVQVNLDARYVSTQEGIRAVVRPVSANHTGVTLLPGTAYRQKTETWNTNPETAATWTVAQFNATQFGVENTGPPAQEP